MSVLVNLESDGGGGGLSSQTNSNPDQPEGRNRAGLSVFLSLRFT